MPFTIRGRRTAGLSWLLLCADLLAMNATAAPSSKLYRGEGFSIRVPAAFAVDPNHDYQALGPDTDIHGVAFTLPPAMAEGTNLARDSYLAVETLPGPGRCSAARFLSSPSVKPAQHLGRIAYSVATSSDAGAGNFYDETVYAVKGSSPCVAVRYFIHSLNIGAFDPGAVRAFDRAALIRRFDGMRRSLRLSRSG